MFTHKKLQQRSTPRLENKTIQPKLKIGQPGDEYEREADRVADAVMRMPNSQLQMQSVEEEEKLQMQLMEEGGEEMHPNLQLKANQGAEASPGLSQKISSTKGSGAQMAPEVEHEMSAKIGADFSGVNIHTDSNAIQMNRGLGSRAFTQGNDIYFNKDEYNPGSSKGKHLLAHELTHVVQQEGKQSSLSAKSKEGQVIQCDPMTDEQRNSRVRSIGLQMALTHSNCNDGAQDAENAIAAASAAEANVAKTIFSMSMALIVPGFGGAVAGGFSRFGISIASSTATNLGNAIGEGAKGAGNEAIDNAYRDNRPASFFGKITSAMQDAMTHTFNYISNNSTNRSAISDQELRDTYVYWETLASNGRSVWSEWFQEQWERYEDQVLAIGPQSAGIVPYGASIDTHENIPVRIRRGNGGTRLALVTHTHVTYDWSFSRWLMDAPSESTTYRFVRWIDDDFADLATSQVSRVPTISEGEIRDLP